MPTGTITSAMPSASVSGRRVISTGQPSFSMGLSRMLSWAAAGATAIARSAATAAVRNQLDVIVSS